MFFCKKYENLEKDIWKDLQPLIKIIYNSEIINNIQISICFYGNNILNFELLGVFIEK